MNRVLVGIGLAVAVLAGLIVCEVRVQARHDKAYEQVATWKNRLSADKDEKGRWKKWPGEFLVENDPWGNPLRVRYESDRRFIRLTVSSDGPDEQQWSSDDITASASNVDW